jgi:chromosomal replication initiator protein
MEDTENRGPDQFDLFLNPVAREPEVSNSDKVRIPFGPITDSPIVNQSPLNIEFWEKLKAGLLDKHASNKPFKNWFEAVEFVSVDRGDFGYNLRLRVPSELHKYWLSENVLEELNGEIALVYSGSFRVEFVVSGNAPTSNYHSVSSGASPEALTTPEAPEPQTSGNIYLNPSYTFGTFVVGRNNEFAHAACFNVAERPGSGYNPLFICGPTGMGKTHLLNAVGNHIREKFPQMRICYLSAERFLNECISGIRRNTMDKFRLRYRERCDVLLIDDIQTLGRGEAVQDEFFHTLNDFFETRRQVIVASDRMPNDIQGLEDRIQSRLQWGLIADIQVSDMETRLAILRYKAEKRGVRLPDDVAHYIASISKKSIRELEGNLNRVTIHMELYGGQLSLDVAKRALVAQTSQLDTLTTEQVQKMVADVFNVKVLDLKSKSRGRPLVTARQVAMFLIKNYLNQSVTDIGRSFNKDHSTVINALQRITNQRLEDRNLDNVIKNLESRIHNILGL